MLGLFLALVQAAIGANATTGVRSVDFNELLQEKDCRVYLQPVIYAKLTGGPGEQAIVVGSSCRTGTAGPDIHAVYTLGAKAKPKSLTISEPDASAYDGLFGNRNYDLVEEKGQLVARWTDTSERKYPLKIRYHWDGRQFRVAAVEKAPTYQASYDCESAKEAHERAICHVKELAALDVTLAEAYRARLRSASVPERKALVESQRKWLAERNRNCTIYKWWVDCLKAAYTKRIAELRG